MQFLLNLSRKRIFLLTLLLVGTISLSGCGTPPVENYDVSLEIWGIFDDSDAYAKVIREYREINPHVKGITYRKLPVETYRDDLINALAAGKGPDIFMMRNSWRGMFEDKAVPAPDVLIPEREYRERLIDVAAADFITKEGKIYGIPLSVDSLALYYNKDLFNAAGIATPPTTWDEVVTAARTLTSIDQFGTITRSGIAMGTGANINRSSDILTALMMQLGANGNGQRNGNSLDFSSDGSKKAFDFYTQFSKIGSGSYTWNARQDYSIDAFYKGDLAMMVNYSWQYDTIKQKNAKLNIGISPLPQFDAANPINLANYWGYAVTKEKPTTPKPGAPPVDPSRQNTLRTFEAWQFLKFLALAGQDKKVTLQNALSGNSREFPLDFDPTKTYLEATRKPAARRDLIAEQKNDVILAPFVSGNLIAENWYQGDSDAVDGILIDTIDSVVRGEKSPQSAFDTATSRINLLSR